jgi:hypothetical protein
MNQDRVITTLADVLALLDEAGLTGTRHRDMVSAVKRVCAMAGSAPASVPAEPPRLREMLARIRPAAHGVSAKSYSNQRSLLAAALQLADVIDPLHRGGARRHPAWGPLLEAVAEDQRLSNGLAAFANWCASQGISPGEVDDPAVQRFLIWVEARTLYPKPRDLAWRVPKLWNEASTKVTSWPTTKLTTLSFKAPPKHLKWSDLSPSFQQDADAYLELRANPDLFDERPEAPKRPLAATTLRQQREHLRLGCFHLDPGWGSRCLARRSGRAGAVQEDPSLLPPPSQSPAQRLRHRRRQDPDPSCPIPRGRNLGGGRRTQARSQQPSGSAL